MTLATAGPEAAKLAAIRGLLEAFGWERDDRQLALERIEQIAEGSRTASGVDPGGVATIVPADLGTVLGALADAVEYCTDEDGCQECMAAAGGSCESHAARLARVPAYRSLARALGDDR